MTFADEGIQVLRAAEIQLDGDNTYRFEFWPQRFVANRRIDGDVIEPRFFSDLSEDVAAAVETRMQMN